MEFQSICLCSAGGHGPGFSEALHMCSGMCDEGMSDSDGVHIDHQRSLWKDTPMLTARCSQVEKERYRLDRALKQSRLRIKQRDKAPDMPGWLAQDVGPWGRAHDILPTPILQTARLYSNQTPTSIWLVEPDTKRMNSGSTAQPNFVANVYEQSLTHIDQSTYAC